MENFDENRKKDRQLDNLINLVENFCALLNE